MEIAIRRVGHFTPACCGELEPDPPAVTRLREQHCSRWVGGRHRGGWRSLMPGGGLGRERHQRSPLYIAL